MCYNVCHLWLPWTLSTVSDSYKTLLDELKARTPTGERSEPLLRAQMSVCMATRRMQIAGLRDLVDFDVTMTKSILLCFRMFR